MKNGNEALSKSEKLQLFTFLSSYNIVLVLYLYVWLHTVFIPYFVTVGEKLPQMVGNYISGIFQAICETLWDTLIPADI